MSLVFDHLLCIIVEHFKVCTVLTDVNFNSIIDTKSKKSGLPPVWTVTCGIYPHPHRQSCLCHQSLGGFGRSLAETCKTLDLYFSTLTAAPCAETPCLFVFHYCLGKLAENVKEQSL